MNQGYYNDNNTYTGIYSFVQGDVNGDHINDYVYLTGSKLADSPFVQEMTLVIQDGRTGDFTNIIFRNNAGYNPKLYLMDFTGNGVADILISIASGGSGGIMYYYIYSFLENKPQMLFDSDVYNDQYEYQVTYMDNYKVEVISKFNDERYIIDISNRDPEYLNEIYDTYGRLIQPVEGFVNPLSGLYPVDFGATYVYELLAYQKIAGRYNADALGYILNTLSWKDNEFVLTNQQVAIP
jgi:hypothetical protein